MAVRRDPRTGRFVKKTKKVAIVHHRHVSTGRFVKIGKGVRIIAHPHTGTPIAYHKAAKRWRHVVYINGKGFFSDFVNGFRTGFSKTAQFLAPIVHHLPGVGPIASAALSGVGHVVGHGIVGMRVSSSVPQGP